MPDFTAALEATLQRALNIASTRHHEYATLEHLLLALIDDEDASDVMRACAVDLDRLRRETVEYLDNELDVLKTKEDTEPSPTSGFQRVVQRAILHMQSSGSPTVTGANVLVALFSERDSYAVSFLREQDFSRLDAVSYISHGVGKASLAQPFTRDFFISYASRDEATAREVAGILSDAGYTTLAQFKDFSPGSNFVREMQRGLAETGRLIALLSPDYEASDHCQAEWAAAYAQDPGSRRGKIVPFLIAPTQLNPLAKQIVYRSLLGLNAQERQAAILEAIRRTPGPRSTSQVLREAAQLASPDVRVQGKQLDAVPNRGTDMPVGRGELVDLVKTLRELVSAVLDGLPSNAPGVVRNCLRRYNKHLTERRTQPILGLLDNLMSPVRKEYRAADMMLWGDGLADLIEIVFRRHEELHGHFPRSDARERFLAETPVDEDKAVGAALEAPVAAASDALKQISDAGFTTPEFDDVVAGQLEQAKDLASLPPASDPEPVGVPTAKNRFVLSQIGFYERILAAAGATATLGMIPAVQHATVVLAQAIRSLLQLLG